ncbi:MAG: hypothetical protein WBC22_05340 [Sedimentisphaerales bacterium]
MVNIQKNNHLPYLSIYKVLFWSIFADFCTFCASLWLIKHLFRRLLKKAVSMALWTKANLCVKSSLLEQSLPRTPIWPKTSMISASKNLYNLLLKICVICGKNLRNLRLINDLRAYKALYNCKDTFTDVMKTLQNNLFMQNKANFRKVKLNVNKVLTRGYDQMDTWSSGKKQSQTNPKRTQSNPMLARHVVWRAVNVCP